MLLLSACATDAESGDSNADVSSGSAALVIAQGGLGDQSYNDLALKGFKKAVADADISGAPIESSDIVGQGEQVLRRAGQANMGLIIDLEYSHSEIVPKVAADFPKSNWVIVNAVSEGDNVASVLFQEQEGSYLAGALAALQTTNTSDPKINADKTIGVIGGTSGAGIDKFIVGFIQGAHDIDPSVEVLSAYSNDFADPTKGQQLAQSMFDQGADIIYTVAGATGMGVIQAATQNDRYAIGVDDNQDAVAPGNVLTSMIKRTDVAVESIVKAYTDGSFPGGTIVSLGLKEDAVGLTDFEYTKDAIGQANIDKIKTIKQNIIDGTVEVWNVVDQGYPDFYTGK